MAKRREETYCAVPSDVAPRCVISGCVAPAVAEVKDADYSVALGMFRGVHRRKVRTRRVGDERFFVCQEHFERDPRIGLLHWQMLIDWGGNL
jgi:hypothetical protein